MTVKVELNALLDLALGQPESGAVNFKILHGFLKKLLGHLPISNVEDVKKVHGGQDGDLEGPKTDLNSESLLIDKHKVLNQSTGAVENRIRGIEDRLHLLDSFSGTDEIMKWQKKEKRLTVKLLIYGIL